MEKNVNEELNDMELGGVSGGVQPVISVVVECDKCGYWVRIPGRYREKKCPECKEGTLRRVNVPMM